MARLNLDELRKVSEKTEALMRHWRTLTHDHELLKKQHSELQNKYEQQELDHAQALSEQQTAQEQIIAALKQGFSEDKTQLETDFNAQIQAITEQYEQQLNHLSQQLSALQRDHKILFDRISGASL